MAHRLLVAYGSDTGTAADAAERVAREGRRRHYKVRCVALDAITPEEMAKETHAVLIASTAGQGEAPASMKGFWRSLLRKSLQADLFSNLHVAVFGLGDSAYPKYNVAAKRLHKRVKMLGASELMALGLGDEQNPTGYEAAFDPWLASLWSRLRERCPLPDGLVDPPVEAEGCIPPLDTPHFQLVRSSCSASSNATKPSRAERLRAASVLDNVQRACNGVNPVDLASSKPHTAYDAPVLHNVRLTSVEHWQDVRHISLDVSQLQQQTQYASCNGDGSRLYNPGDLAAIMPEQASEDIHAFIERLGLPPNQLLHVYPYEYPDGFDSETVKQLEHAPLRIEDLVAGCLDVNSASPSRYFFEVLSHYAQSDIERERLQFFASAEGRDDLQLYNNRERRTVFEILHDFSTASPPLEYLLQIVPRLRERYFSISSSPSKHSEEVHLTVAVVEFTTPYKRHRKGLCSNWLASLEPLERNVTVPMWLDSGALSLPSDYRDALFIGPGTGVAPFRSMIHERDCRKTKGIASVASTTLAFGCRGQYDYLYNQEWAEVQQHGRCLEPPGGHIVAFSRERERKHINHALLDEAEKIWRVLHNSGCVYVSGRAGQMPADVHEALQSVVEAKGGLDERGAKAFLKRCESLQLLAFETWS